LFVLSPTIKCFISFTHNIVGYTSCDAYYAAALIRILPVSLFVSRRLSTNKVDKPKLSPTFIQSRCNRCAHFQLKRSWTINGYS